MVKLNPWLNHPKSSWIYSMVKSLQVCVTLWSKTPEGPDDVTSQPINVELRAHLIRKLPIEIQLENMSLGMGNMSVPASKKKAFLNLRYLQTYLFIYGYSFLSNIGMPTNSNEYTRTWNPPKSGSGRWFSQHMAICGFHVNVRCCIYKII